MKIVFKKIYIFDILTKKAFVTGFEEGVNVITSSIVDGTDRGKSVLLRSLYHVLGADSHFDKKWENECKVYLLEFLIDRKKYLIYRYRKVFKIFDKEFNIILQTSSRTELSEFLSKIWDFEIFLPNRNTEKLEIAPPAYTYVMNFIDQDFYDGTRFNSFKNLTQYKNFKSEVIYSHLGVYNRQYFEKIKRKEKLLEEFESSKRLSIKVNMMREKISSLIGNIIVPENKQELEWELNIKSKEYNDLLSSMNECRYKLTNLRNEKYELKAGLIQIKRYKENKEKEIRNILNKDICPECHTVLDDTLKLRSRRYNDIENSEYITDRIYEELEKVKQKINKLENIYIELSKKLKKYKKNMNITKSDIDNYASYMGLNNLYNSLNKDINKEINNQLKLSKSIVNIEEDLKKITKDKMKINKKYYDMIDYLVMKFGLNEIEDNQYKAINRFFTASGSNKPIATVIWYLTLNNLKKYFNTNSLCLPMVLDSPKNAEMDTYKEKALIEYILEESSNYFQLIFSSIGFNKSDFKFKGNINVIELKNDKYQLLDYKTYNDNEELINMVINLQKI